jgi:hypothetical protein
MAERESKEKELIFDSDNEDVEPKGAKKDGTDITENKYDSISKTDG